MDYSEEDDSKSMAKANTNMQEYVSEARVLFLVWLLLLSVIKIRNSLLLDPFPS